MRLKDDVGLAGDVVARAAGVREERRGRGLLSRGRPLWPHMRRSLRIRQRHIHRLRRSLHLRNAQQ